MTAALLVNEVAAIIYSTVPASVIVPWGELDANRRVEYEDAARTVITRIETNHTPTDDMREAVRAEVEKVQRAAWAEIHGQEPTRKYSVAEVKQIVYSFDNVLASLLRLSAVPVPRGDVVTLIERVQMLRRITETERLDVLFDAEVARQGRLAILDEAIAALAVFEKARTPTDAPTQAGPVLEVEGDAPKRDTPTDDARKLARAMARVEQLSDHLGIPYIYETGHGPVRSSTAPPVYLAADLWDALGAPIQDFDAYYERNRWADTWSNLLSTVRDHFRPKCGQDTEGERCVLSAGHLPPHYGSIDVGSSEPVPVAHPQAEPSDALTIPRPHVPFGPHGVPEHEADAVYLDHAANNLEGKFEVGGSNVRATVVKLLRDAAAALRAAGVGGAQ